MNAMQEMRRDRAPDGMTWLHLRLPVRPEAAARARHAVASLGDRLDSDSLEALTLLVSELVTNAVLYAGAAEQPIELVVRPASGGVHVEVIDRGHGFDPQMLAPPHLRQRGGWGLYLVEKLADRWGVEVDDTTNVWFEIDRVGA